MLQLGTLDFRSEGLGESPDREIGYQAAIYEPTATRKFLDLLRSKKDWISGRSSHGFGNRHVCVYRIDRTNDFDGPCLEISNCQKEWGTEFLLLFDQLSDMAESHDISLRDKSR